MRHSDTAARARSVGTEQYATRHAHRYADLVGRHWPIPKSVDTVEPRTSTRDIEAAIEKSRRILDLKRGWDDEDALPCVDAWRRATAFLRGQAEWAAQHMDFSLQAPEIMPLASGSIDLHWDTPDYELLINVPGDPKQPATFYGDDRGRQHVKGTLAPDSVDEDLLQWITRRLSRNGRRSTSPTRTSSTSEYIGST